MRPVSDLMTRGPVTVDPALSVADALRHMQELDAHHLAVVEMSGEPMSLRLAGVFSERDLLVHERAHPGADRAALRVADVMTPAPFVVRADTNASVVARAMVSRRLEVSVVVDAGVVAGVFSCADALRALADGDEPSLSAKAPPRLVLCPIDFSAGSRAAVRMAVELAGRGGEVTLFHAVPAPPVTLGEVAIAGASSIERSDIEASASLRAWRDEHSSPRGPSITVAKALGGAADAIVHHAEERAFAFIVLATHGRTGLSRVLQGSVAEKVVRHARCPVLVVHG